MSYQSKQKVVSAPSLSPVDMSWILLKPHKRFQRMADNLFALKFITSSVVDNVKFQYDQSMTKKVVINQEKFLKFNFKHFCYKCPLFRFVESDEANFYRHSWAELYWTRIYY